MPFTTPFWRNAQTEQLARLFCAWLLFFAIGSVQAQVLTEVTPFRVDRVEEEVLVSAQMVFELPAAVEDALLKSIPMTFVAEAELLRERWYWYDRKVRSVERRMRLAYQPLTRRWRLNVTSGPGAEANQGLSLNQSFDTLAQALSAIKRISRWKLAEAGSLDGGAKYRVEFRFKLDVGQLPSPFQIGALGQSEWDIKASASTALPGEPVK
jgi:hypothetical protein